MIDKPDFLWTEQERQNYKAGCRDSRNTIWCATWLLIVLVLVVGVAISVKAAAPAGSCAGLGAYNAGTDTWTLQNNNTDQKCKDLFGNTTYIRIVNSKITSNDTTESVNTVKIDIDINGNVSIENSTIVADGKNYTTSPGSGYDGWFDISATTINITNSIISANAGGGNWNGGVGCGDGGNAKFIVNASRFTTNGSTLNAMGGFSVFSSGLCKPGDSTFTIRTNEIVNMSKTTIQAHGQTDYNHAYPIPATMQLEIHTQNLSVLDSYVSTEGKYGGNSGSSSINIINATNMLQWQGNTYNGSGSDFLSQGNSTANFTFNTFTQFKDSNFSFGGNDVRIGFRSANFILNSTTVNASTFIASGSKKLTFEMNINNSFAIENSNLRMVNSSGVGILNGTFTSLFYRFAQQPNGLLVDKNNAYCPTVINISSITNTTFVGVCWAFASVNISSDLLHQITPPTVNATYTISVGNNGSGREVFNLSLTFIGGVPDTYNLTNVTMNLSAGEVQNTIVRITDADVGWYNASVNVVSWRDSSVFANVTLNTTVSSSYGIFNQTFNATVLIVPTANYTFTFNFSNFSTFSNCWVKVGPVDYNATATVLGNGYVCNVSAELSTLQELTAFPMANDTSGIVYGTNQSLIQVFREAVLWNNTVESDVLDQYFLLQHRIYNPINQTHTFSFYPNYTSFSKAVNLLPFANVSVNSSYSVPSIFEKSNYTLRDVVSSCVINRSGYNFSLAFDINTSIFGLPSPVMNITEWMAGWNGTDLGWNVSLNYSIIGNTEIVNFTVPSIAANTSVRFVLNWTGKASNLTTSGAVTQTVVGATTIYQKQDSVFVFVANLTHSGTYDTGIFPNWASRVNENFTAFAPNGSAEGGLRNIVGAFVNYNFTGYTIGDYATKEVYTYNSGGGGGSPGGGGGGGGGPTLTIINYGKINLSVSPILIEKLCNLWDVPGGCARSAVANKQLKSCDVFNQTGNVSCKFQNASILLTTWSGNMTGFSKVVDAKVRLESIDGEISTINYQETFLWWGMYLPGSDVVRVLWVAMGVVLVALGIYLYVKK